VGDGEDVAGGEESSVVHRIAFERLRIAVLRGFSDLQDVKMTLQATAEEVVANQLGDWFGQIAQHGSVERAIEAVTEPQLRQLEEVVSKARAKMEERVLQLETRGGADKSALSQVIRKLVNTTAKRAEDAEIRLHRLEQAVQAGSGTGWMGGGASTTTTIDGNTLISVVDIGGNPVSVSMMHLFQKLRYMESKVSVLSERAKNGGVLFGQWGVCVRARVWAVHGQARPSWSWSCLLGGHHVPVENLWF
jgi:hypothetical protein